MINGSGNRFKKDILNFFAMNAASFAPSSPNQSNVFSDMFHRMTTSHNTNNPSATAASNSQMATTQLKNILNRTNISLTDKIFELQRHLATPANTSHANNFHPSHHVLTPKDLSHMFLLLIGDIFGSQAVQHAKYGNGWNLTSLTRGRHYRDYNAALTFLGSTGVLMQVVNMLTSDSGFL